VKVFFKAYRSGLKGEVMTHPWQQSKEGDRDLLGLVCSIIALLLLMLAVMVRNVDASATRRGSNDYVRRQYRDKRWDSCPAVASGWQMDRV
jgi:hypothetical protein